MEVTNFKTFRAWEVTCRGKWEMCKGMAFRKSNADVRDEVTWLDESRTFCKAAPNWLCAAVDGSVRKGLGGKEKFFP